jgi:hypothetical protein
MYSNQMLFPLISKHDGDTHLLVAKVEDKFLEHREELLRLKEH